MKTLVLVRHAKSSWDNPLLNDFDRPLNKRGERDAPCMAKRLKHENIIPQVIVSSPANRAITTAQIFSQVLLDGRAPVIIDSIYESSAAGLMHILRQLDNKFSNVMLIGHNPGLTDLLNLLVLEKIENMPTCSIAVVNFAANDWQQLAQGSGHLQQFDYPKKAPGC